MNTPIDMTKMKLSPFELVERVPSKYFAYDLAVVKRQHPVWGETLAMVEVSQADTENFSYWVSFSEAYSDPGRMHFTPLPFTLVTTSVILAFMGQDKKLVIAGLGGGLAHTFVRNRMFSQGLDQYDFSIETVEPDQAVIDLAVKHFAFNGNVAVGGIDEYIERYDGMKIDVLYLNNFCQYVNTKAHDIFDDYEKLDLYFSRMSDTGVLLVNCFNYLDDFNPARADQYAKSRGMEIDVMHLQSDKSPQRHNLVMIGKSTLPPL